MIGYVDPEAAVVNGKGNGADRRRALGENMIAPAGPPTAIPREVGDPVSKLMLAKAKSCGWVAPAGGVGPVPETLAMGPRRFVGGNLPGAVEIARKDGKVMWLGAVGITDFVNANLNVFFGGETCSALLEFVFPTRCYGMRHIVHGRWLGFSFYVPKSLSENALNMESAPGRIYNTLKRDFSH